MKLMIVLALFAACAIAAPQQPVETLKFVNDIQEGGYNFLYETSDGQKRDETGQLKDAPPTPENPNNKVIDIFGSYEFTSPEGRTYRVEYTSGVNGFLPKVSIVN
ncbi:endocuticle structural glycoprotein SgAbd-5-like [Chironomus tepperi]|uniref:endocuticle structural glycoprotein SgAbd-5-like n=1 Tax=Chironomus tepperi TaxID=113505 RepID=UPI00391FA2B7